MEQGLALAGAGSLCLGHRRGAGDQPLLQAQGHRTKAVSVFLVK